MEIKNFTGESTPILMLPMDEDDVNPRCYSLTKGRLNKLNLPEAKGHHCYSSLGWLLIASHAGRFEIDSVASSNSYPNRAAPESLARELTRQHVNKYLTYGSTSQGS